MAVRLKITSVFLFFILVYFRVPFIFFQQDEWYAFGNMIALGPKLIFHRFEVGDINHFVPLNSLLSFLLFKIFDLNYVGYNAVALFLHFINGLLVYFLALRILKRKTFALLSAATFIASAASAGLVMWPLVGINTLTLTFALLAWIAALRFKEQKKVFVNGLVVAILTILALLTNEYAGGMLIFIPVLIFVLSKKDQLVKASKFLLPFIVFGFGYLFFRLSIVGGVLAGGSSLKTILPKIIQFPVRYLGQLLIPKQGLLLVDQILGNNLALSDLVLRDVFFWFGLAVLGLVLVVSAIVRRVSPTNYQNLILVTIFILASSIPFAFIPGKAGNFLLFSPRYLYFGIAGGAILIALLAEFAYLSERSFLKKLAGFYILLFFFLGVFGNWSKAGSLLKEGKLREGILNEIKSKYTSLPKKTIFYTESDSSFYGLPPEEKIMPFQSGFGQTLLVWYQAEESFPKEFFEDRYLWEITDQGYQEVAGRGFGYFRDFGLMNETIEKENLAPSSIIAFRYDSEDTSFEDMTEEVQGRIKGFAVNKRLLPGPTLKVTAIQNPDDVYLAVDGNRRTKWDTKLPYGHPQFLVIDLKRPRKIAQVRIDSYNNKDQNTVGYSVLLSDDGQVWREVFYAKRYPPNADGFSDLYFEPQFASFIKIEQKGEHRFAPWVIHELKVYEATN